MIFRRSVASGLFVCALAGGACGRTPETPPVNAGSVPQDQDRDGDGLPDKWEVSGVDYVDPTDEQRKHLDLKAMGASPTHKDILLWIAWMESPEHSHRLEDESFGIVERAFHAAPVQNIDGFPGVSIHAIWSSKSVAEKPILGEGTADSYRWSDFDVIKKKFLPATFDGSAFFVVFAHDITAAHNSGIARSIP